MATTFPAGMSLSSNVTKNNNKLWHSVSVVILIYILYRMFNIIQGQCEYADNCVPFIDMETLDLTFEDGAGGPDKCIIPKLSVFPPSLKKLWKTAPMVNCDHIVQLFEPSTIEKAGRMLPYFTGKCCAQEVIRGQNDFHFNLSKCQQIQAGDKLPQNFESMFITCGSYMNAEANVPLKDNIKVKLNHWNRAEMEKPVSVLLFGIESTSRMHLYRSLPKSMKMMKALGFVDFSGFHSLGPSTLTNYMGFLMGLPRSVVRGGCAPNWTTPYDKCPLIWNNFSNANYITAYFEDGPQSFNFGGQSGFVKQPTDYYIHPLFFAVRKSRKDWMYKRANRSDACLSKEIVPKFLLRHTLRFLHKFKQVPFFAFTFWADPFHADFYSLADFDKDLVNLFKFFQATPQILQDTLIIFLSDHGDRHNFFSRQSVASYFERALPPLFIRLPNKLAKYPQFSAAFKSNANQLVTPFDVHHTLLHILSLSNQSSDSFKPSLTDRSSLFVKLPPNRTCASTNIPVGFCVCNTGCGSGPCDLDNIQRNLDRGTLEQILEFAVKKLNERVQGSRFGRRCEIWRAKFSDIKYTRVVKASGRYFEVVIAFDAQPGGATFEARLKVTLEKVQRYAKIIGFARVSKYGDESRCVDLVTDADKELKSLCMCKNVLARKLLTTNKLLTTEGFAGSHGVLSLFHH